MYHLVLAVAEEDGLEEGGRVLLRVLGGAMSPVNVGREVGHLLVVEHRSALCRLQAAQQLSMHQHICVHDIQHIE
jgi:hypothetical protein